MLRGLGPNSVIRVAKNSRLDLPGRIIPKQYRVPKLTFVDSGTMDSVLGQVRIDRTWAKYVSMIKKSRLAV